jgi:hypothetical protein
VNEPTIALVFTPDAWVEELHRHCTDHGGARVRQVLIEPALALEEHYDVLVVSHRWPALTHGLVDDLHARGRRVLGVFDRDEPIGNDLLVAVGADATVASDAGPAGIVGALRAMDGDSPGEHRPGAEVLAVPAARAPITLVSGPTGAGATEIAIALGVAYGDTIVIDADDVAPAVAPRLGLALEPNLRSAIDAVEHDGGAPDDHAVRIASTAARVVAGLASPATWSHLRPAEVLRLCERLALQSGRVIVNVAGTIDDVPVAMARPRYAVARAALAEADDIVAVGAADPVGVGRLLHWVASARALAPRTALHVVANRAPKDRFRRSELVEELGNSFGVASVTVVPHDRRVETAAWNGALVTRGPFTRAVAALARDLAATDGTPEPEVHLRAVS